MKCTTALTTPLTRKSTLPCAHIWVTDTFIVFIILWVFIFGGHCVECVDTWKYISIWIYLNVFLQFPVFLSLAFILILSHGWFFHHPNSVEIYWKAATIVWEDTGKVEYKIYDIKNINCNIYLMSISMHYHLVFISLKSWPKLSSAASFCEKRR